MPGSGSRQREPRNGAPGGEEWGGQRKLFPLGSFAVRMTPESPNAHHERTPKREERTKFAASPHLSGAPLVGHPPFGPHLSGQPSGGGFRP